MISVVVDFHGLSARFFFSLDFAGFSEENWIVECLKSFFVRQQQ